MPVIERGDDHFAVVTYTGNGSTQTISGLRFQPDFVWIKSRSNAVEGPLFDAVRGTTKGLFSSLTNAEFTDNTTLTSFNSDGFTLGGNTHTNLNNYTYVAWCWKANGAGSSNTAGTISSTVSANTTAGFSVVTFTSVTSTANTIGHGLGVAPEMVIMKTRGSSAAFTGWAVYHKSTTAGGYLVLNTTAAYAANTTTWNNTAPTSTVFSMGTGWGTSDNFVAYCFAPIAGYSAFGSYVGNGSTDGPFIFTGHLPRWIMVKRTDSSIHNWIIIDTAREPYNTVGDTLYANASDAETSNNNPFDVLSNGFKLRNTGGNANVSGATYIYAAFAENPFRYSLAF